MQEVVLAIAGSGGDGVITAGDFITKSAARKGLYAFMLKSYGPQIRGGESSARIRVSAEPIYSQGDYVDVLAVFSWKDFKRFTDEIEVRENAVVLYDDADKTPLEAVPIPPEKKARFVGVPFKRLASEELKVPLAKNMVLLGVLARLLNLPIDALKDSVMQKFGRKRPEAAEVNIKAIDLGARWVEENLPEGIPYRLEAEGGEPKLVMTGNDALAFGAIHAGVKFYSGYPITPASPILEFLARELPRFGGAVIQTEDELAAAAMAIGASWAGARAMTASSGPGISLKQEAIGLAAMAEIPLVVVNVQRTGPSTGIPSKTEQADLFQAIGGTHGDAPRVVLAPADVEDNFQVAVEAFYLAEKYQLPVYILSDQFVAERSETVDEAVLFARERAIARKLPSEAELGEEYARYKLTEDGVSPMAVPGMKGGQHYISGLEHNEKGWPSSSGTLHQVMSEKRARKLPLIAEEAGFVRIYGDGDAELAVLAWGSSKGAVREAVERARKQGMKVKAIVPQLLFPVPARALDEALKGVERALVVELSFTAQFYRYLRAFYDGLPKETYSYARAGGNPLRVDEVLAAIAEHYGKKVEA